MAVRNRRASLRQQRPTRTVPQKSANEFNAPTRKTNSFKISSSLQNSALANSAFGSLSTMESLSWKSFEKLTLILRNGILRSMDINTLSIHDLAAVIAAAISESKKRFLLLRPLLLGSDFSPHRSNKRNRLCRLLILWIQAACLTIFLSCLTFIGIYSFIGTTILLFWIL